MAVWVFSRALFAAVIMPDSRDAATRLRVIEDEDCIVNATPPDVPAIEKEKRVIPPTIVGVTSAHVVPLSRQNLSGTPSAVQKSQVRFPPPVGAVTVGLAVDVQLDVSPAGGPRQYRSIDLSRPGIGDCSSP